jgi:hypothetical protein
MLLLKEMVSLVEGGLSSWQGWVRISRYKLLGG